MLQNSILLYITFFTITICYTFKEVSQYENITLILTTKNPFTIYKFNNQPYQLNEGYIDIFFQKNNYRYINVYIYDDFSKIQETNKGEFINYKDHSNVESYSKLASFSKFENGYYYIIISTPDYNYEDFIMIFNSQKSFQFLPNTIFSKEFYLGGISRTFNFLTPLFQSEKYLHFMAYKNQIGYYKSEIIINEGIDGEKIFYLGEITDFNLHKVFLLKSNINYEIKFFLNVPYAQETFKLSIYFSDYNIIEPIDNYNNYLEIPIIQNMMSYYIHFEVEIYDENEYIYFKINKYYYNKGLNFL
jgi:hypothetical protein